VLEERVVIARERVPRLRRDLGDAADDLDVDPRSVAGTSVLATGSVP